MSKRNKSIYKILNKIKDLPFIELKELNKDLLTMAKDNYELAIERVQEVKPKVTGLICSYAN